MKQYKLTAWPDLPARFQKTPMRRCASELSQRFVSVRDLAKHSGAPSREVEDLLEHLRGQGMLMSRDAPKAVNGGRGWPGLGALSDLLGRVRAWR